MRTQDKTYISKLGFNDRDKGDSIHDMAIKYLALEENVNKLINLFGYSGDFNSNLEPNVQIL